MTNSQVNRLPLKKFSALAVLLTFVSFTPASLLAEDAKDAPKETVESSKVTLKPVDKNAFEYQIEGRPDPFEPFLTPKVKSNVDMDEIIDAGDVLTGMQLFEPGQLNLVGIMQLNDAHIAMVEDSTGKGYVLNQGMKIGRRGIIVEINSHKVIIEETAVTRAQKVIKSKIEMVLTKEGEE